MPKNLEAYEDIRKYLDQALESENGLLIRTATSGKAIYLAQRFNTLRTLDRKASLEIYEIEDPRRGTSSWDTLDIRADGPGVRILRQSPLTVVEL
jgi:hypothetical protein